MSFKLWYEGCMHINRLYGIHLVAIAFAGAFSVSSCSGEGSLNQSSSAPDAVSAPVVTPVGDKKDAAMNASISPDLVAAFERSEEPDNFTRRVIITLEESSAAATLKSVQGVKVLNTMQSAPIVIAEVNALGLKGLSENPAITRVEADGEMQAQPNRD